MRGTARECAIWLLAQDDSKRYEAKEVKERRSTTQNGYYWAMLNKLARVLRMSDTEVHLNMLREYGQCEVFSVSLSVPLEAYFDYFDVLGVDWQDGEGRHVVKVYKGSSKMDSTEFSRLIDGMREECVAQGIDVATPEEIASMRFVEGM